MCVCVFSCVCVSCVHVCVPCQLLRTASLQANVYNMEPGQVLLQVDKGWMFNDVMRFVMRQPEVAKGYKDGKDYLPSMYSDDDDEL